MSRLTVWMPFALATLACAETPAVVVESSGASTAKFAGSEWAQPEHLPAPINSPFRELAANLSPDGLSLYFGSDRPGGSGDVDMWVAHRDCPDCEWGAPVNLGPILNTNKADGSPVFSRDGHLLFFSSNRTGTLGGDDIWMSVRTDTHDDFAWGEPINLGPLVNGPGGDGPGTYLARGEDGDGVLYFNRSGDIYSVSMTRDGVVTGPIEIIPAVNSTAPDNGPMVRQDGKEMILWSTRTSGSLGQADIWVSARQNEDEPWGTPVNIGPTINTPAADLTPTVSRDGRTLLFSAGATARPGLGLQDIWMSTRTPSGR